MKWGAVSFYATGTICFILWIQALGVFGEKSWKPFLLSLAMDCSSQTLHGATKNMTEVEQREIVRRRFGLVNYLLRSPFYDKKSKVVSLSSWILIIMLSPGYYNLVAEILPRKHSTSWLSVQGPAEVSARVPADLLLYLGLEIQKTLLVYFILLRHSIIILTNRYYAYFYSKSISETLNVFPTVPATKIQRVQLEWGNWCAHSFK